MLQFNMNVLWTVINLLILFLLMKKFLYSIPANKSGLITSRGTRMARLLWA